jgi:hypothetical protein
VSWILTLKTNSKKGTKSETTHPRISVSIAKTPIKFLANTHNAAAASKSGNAGLILHQQ